MSAKDTSASDVLVGFDYQFYYFFYLILNLRHNEKIGLEVKDDVHVEFADGTVLYIQAKHSVQTNASGDIINLTERDHSLWKTLSSWANLIHSQSDCKAFLAKSKFQLVTNKNNSKNPFFLKLNRLQNSDTTVEEFKAYLENLRNDTEDSTIRGYIADVTKLSKTIFKQFLLNLQFDLSEDNLIERIKIRLLEKIHISEKVQDVYNSLHSALRDNNYLTIKQGARVEISFEEFNMKFKRSFQAGLNPKLPIRDVSITIPEDPSKQLFIKQLIDIGDLRTDEKDRIIELTTHLLRLFNNLKEWEATDGLSAAIKAQFNKESIIIWKNAFGSLYREIKNKSHAGISLTDMEEDIKRQALACLDQMRRQILSIDETQLDTELSNGQFYLLTEEKTIGWHFDWENRYKK